MVFGTSAGPVHALANITLDVARGEFIALIGPSGCGKSTLLRLIADVLQPTRGTIEIRGGPPSRARLAREFGFVFQHPGLLLWRDALANVSLPLAIGAWGRRHASPHRPEAFYPATRVFVFTPRPGRVQEEVAIELPSPRVPSMKDTPEFLRHTATLRRALAKSS